MAFFYQGPWAVEIPPGYSDAVNWCLPHEPGTTQHYTDTLAPEDLLENPENIAEFPQEIQAGDEEWVVAPEQTIGGWYLLQGF
jgi:hypothetical protein